MSLYSVCPCNTNVFIMFYNRCTRVRRTRFMSKPMYLLLVVSSFHETRTFSRYKDNSLPVQSTQNNFGTFKIAKRFSWLDSNTTNPTTQYAARMLIFVYCKSYHVGDSNTSAIFTSIRPIRCDSHLPENVVTSVDTILLRISWQ